MPGIQCRGRNGWFDLDEISTVTDDRYAIVDLFSRKRGKNPPIIIHGDRTELERLFRDVAEIPDRPCVSRAAGAGSTGPI